MENIPKTKGKKATKAKTKSDLVMENPVEQKVVNKKRKFNEIEEGTVEIPSKKKAKKKGSNIDLVNNETNDINSVLSQPSKKVNKKVKRKSELESLLENDVNNHLESEENVEPQTGTNTRQKKSKNNALLANRMDTSTRNEENIFPTEQVIDANEVVIKKNPAPKKSKKKNKQTDIKFINQHNDVYNNVDTHKESLELSKLQTDHHIQSVNNSLDLFEKSADDCSLKNDIDIHENGLNSTETHVTERHSGNLNNNEVKREVNVVDIKNEDEENMEKVVTISIQDVDGVNTNKDEDELLKQLERKLKPKAPKEPIDWPDVDLRELLRRIETCTPVNDNKPFMRRLEQLQWENIVFKNYTAEQCRTMWFRLQKKVRKFRLLNEVLSDAKNWVQNYIKSRGGPVATTPVKKKGRPQKHPDMPRKPLTAYFIFYLEKRDSYLTEHPGVDAAEVSKALAQIFQSLSPEEKKKYEEISQQKKIEYHQKLEEFYNNHPEIPRVTKESKVKPEKVIKPPKLTKEKPGPKPGPKPSKEKPPPKPVKEKSLKLPKDKLPTRPHPPFHYFYVSELEKENVEDKSKFREVCKERWKQLPERNKLVWIHYAEAEIAKYEEELQQYIINHPEFVKNPLKPILSKEDMQIKDRAAGKPIKPPGSAYNLFASKLLQSDEIKKVPVRDRLIFVSNQWKYVTEEEKKYYVDMYNELRQKYKQEYSAYLETLPEEERKALLKKNTPKINKVEGEKKVVKKELKKKKPSEKTTSRKPSKIAANKETPRQPVEKLKEPQQPPISPFKYFCTVYTGEEPAAQAWKALSKEQKKEYEEQLIQKKKDYIRDFEKFLKSLSEEELEAFSKSRQRAKEENQNDEESDSYDSEDSSDNEAENEEEDG